MIIPTIAGRRRFPKERKILPGTLIVERVITIARTDRVNGSVHRAPFPQMRPITKDEINTKFLFRRRFFNGSIETYRFMKKIVTFSSQELQDFWVRFPHVKILVIILLDIDRLGKERGWITMTG
jgi:hypothetical protein